LAGAVTLYRSDLRTSSRQARARCAVLRDAREQFRLLSLYQRFEHIVVLILTALIAVVIVAAVWSLSLKILFGLVLTGGLDPSDYPAFQVVFGMIFTVIIALEFKKITSGSS